MADGFPLTVNDVLPPAIGVGGMLLWQGFNEDERQMLAPWQSFVMAVADGSPYLRHLISHAAQFTAGLLQSGPQRSFEEIIAALKSSPQMAGQAEFMANLRQQKARAALLIALADIAHFWTVDEVVAALTLLADTMLQASIDWLLLVEASKGSITPADIGNPSLGCGYVALAMGKQGAGELNYSSDIDLIILYDPETAPVAPHIEPGQFFVRITRRLVQLLQETTEDGYGLRVDLRLRPDPRATQVAIAIEAAAIYYESMGQNWERAAMIKARAAAGDKALGEEFLDRLKPYIWRKYLDFAAIADVQALKRQIHAVKGHGQIAVLGHNVKLGRGGIREIEFFVQTQQLIAGGRNPKLRGLRTLDMLDALAQASWITAEAAAALKEAYRFLRTIEHRLQMVDDEQTQVLPAGAEQFARFAAFAGYADDKALAALLQNTFETVQTHYAALFEQAHELGHELGNLVFTGGEDDPDTIETLQRLSFKQPSEVSATVRGWHFGRYAAMRSGRAKEALTELMPALLTALARGGEADQAFNAFDRFLAGLPAGLQLFSLLQANPRLLELIAMILSSAPRLSEQISSRPRVLDAVLDPGFFGPLPSEAELAALVASAMPDDVGTEELADRARMLGREQMFRIGVRVLSDTLSAEEAGAAFSTLAGLLLARLHAAVTSEIEAKHGRFPGGASCVVAMGKLGGREMTASSDLDLMVVYSTDDQAELSDGAKPLSVGQYYARLTQRFITMISAPTSEGILYEVDMRLRPSGNKGPVAASLASFITYQAESAWTWEKLALTRARVVAGSPVLSEKLAAAIRESLCEKRETAKIRQDVLDMRKLMLAEHKPQSIWDIKRSRGGLVELEFIAQFLQLIHAEELPTVLSTNTFEALQNLSRAGILGAGESLQLREACQLLHRLTQLLRLALPGNFDPASATRGLKEMVARAAAAPDIAVAEAVLAEILGQVAAIFDRLIGQPA